MCTLKVTSIWKAEKIQKTVQPFTKCWENSSKHCFCWFCYMFIAVYFTGFRSLLNITCILKIKFNQCDLQPHMYKQLNSHVISWGKRQVSRKLRPQTSDFRHRKLRPLGKNKKKDLNLTQFLSLEMLYGHAVFMGNIQKGARYLLLTHPADTNCKTDFNLNNIIATLSFYFFSKKFTGKCHQCVGCYFKPC